MPSPGPAAAPAAGFAVLVVCTGNICRSPATERLLGAWLGQGSGVSVSSAGTRAVVGHPVAPPMVPLLVGAGGVADGFVARQLTAPAVRGADLVLAMTRAHRSAVVTLEPAAVRRTFTLLELARILGADRPPADGGTTSVRLAAVTARAALARRPHPVGQEADDIEDPWGGSDQLYARVFAQIRGAVEVVVRAARV